MLARGRRESITDVRKPENGYDVIVGGELFTDYSDHPRKTCHAKPKTEINRQAPDATSFFPVGGCLPQAVTWKTSLRTDAVALQQIKERGALPMIDRGDIRFFAIDRCSNIWASLPGAGYGQFDTRPTAWLQNSKKRAERSGEIDVWAESPRLSPLWLSVSSSACRGLLIITVITPLPTKPSATKMPENWSWRTRQLLTCRCAKCDVAALMQNTLLS